MGQKLTDCSRLELNAIQIFNQTLNDTNHTMNNDPSEQIELEWNDLERIGFFSKSHWESLAFLIPFLIILIMACLIPNYIFYVFYPKYDKKQKELLIKEKYTKNKRSEVFEMLTPYFGDNDDYFLISMILDYANILNYTNITLNQIKTYTNRSHPQLVSDGFIQCRRNILFTCIAAFSVGYIFLFHSAIAIHHTVTVFTKVTVEGGYDNNYWFEPYEFGNVPGYYVIKHSSMKKICDPESINIDEYLFVAEKRNFTRSRVDDFYVHPKELTFAASREISWVGYLLGAILLFLITVYGGLWINTIKLNLCDTYRVFEGDDDVEEIELVNTRQHGNQVYTQINNDTVDRSDDERKIMDESQDGQLPQVVIDDDCNEGKRTK